MGGVPIGADPDAGPQRFMSEFNILSLGKVPLRGAETQRQPYNRSFDQISVNQNRQVC